MSDEAGKALADWMAAYMKSHGSYPQSAWGETAIRLLMDHGQELGAGQRDAARYRHMRDQSLKDALAKRPPDFAVDRQAFADAFDADMDAAIRKSKN